MAKVMYCTYQKDSNEFLESLDLFPATIEAKIHALKYSIDLNEVSKMVIGNIELKDVVNYYNKILPNIKTINQEIVSQLEYGIENKDIKLLERYIKIAESKLTEINDNVIYLIEDAKKLVFEAQQMKQRKSPGGPESPGPETESLGPETESPGTSVTKTETPKMSYVVSRRRRKK